MHQFNEYLEEDDSLLALAKAVVTQACKDYLAYGGRIEDEAFKRFCVDSIWMSAFEVDGLYIYEQMKKKKEEKLHGKRTRKPRQDKGTYNRTVKKVDSKRVETMDKRENRGSK